MVPWVVLWSGQWSGQCMYAGAAGAHLPAQLNDLRHRHLVALLFVRNCGSENHQAAQQPGGVVGAPDDHDGACTVADPSAPW